MKPGVFEKSNIKKTVAILICVMLAVAFRLPLTVHAQESDKTVRVGWYESPFNLTDEFGRRSGYAYEYQQKIAAYTGWNYEYVEGSWPDLFQMLIDGEIDLMSDVSYTDERSELMLFSELPMGAEDYFVFVAPSSESGINSEDLSSFNGKRIGINKGGHDLFWKAVESSDTDAKAMLLDVLQKNTTGDPEKLVNGYLSHIRRFRLFLASEGTAEAKKETQSTAVKPAAPAQYRRKSDIVVPTPSKEQVEYYLTKWDELENYHLQEDAWISCFLSCARRIRKSLIFC